MTTEGMDKLLERGIARPSKALWAAQVLCVCEKKTELCGYA